MQATANARGRRIAGQLLRGRAVEKRRSSNSDARPSTCISSKVAPSSPSIARYKLNEAEAIRRAQGGDQLMFEHLYRLHSRRVFWSTRSSCPLPYARTSLQAQVHDKSGALDPLLGSVCTHPVCEIATHDPLSLPLRSAGIRSTSAKTSNEIIRCLRSRLQRVSRFRLFHCRRINSPETGLMKRGCSAQFKANKRFSFIQK